MRTSYLVPTYRRPKELAVCLQSLLAQVGFDTSQDEILVIDNCPEGSAQAIVASYPSVRYEREPVPGVAAVRNHAFRSARGESFVLIDDDQEAAPTMTEALRSAMELHNGDLGFASIEAILEGETEGPRAAWERLFARLWEDPEGELAKNRVPALSTGGVIVKRQAALDVFGAEDPFNLSFGRTGGEDIAFFRRMRKAHKRLLWVPRARIIERVPPSRLTRAFLLERRFSSGQLRTLLEGQEGHHRTLAFMALGSAQTLVGLTRTVAAKVAAQVRPNGSNQDSVQFEADLAAGLGKVLFFGPFRKKRYGG
jgi:succinoglycan biosynthesis protein ExoM